MNFLPAPPINTPNPAFMAELVGLLDQGRLNDGPLLHFDPQRQLFLHAVIAGGVMVHWQVECCRDQAEAAVLRASALAHVAALLEQYIGDGSQLLPVSTVSNELRPVALHEPQGSDSKPH